MKERFDYQKDGVCRIVIDRVTGAKCTFIRGAFNESQQFDYPDPRPAELQSAIQVARFCRAVGEFVLKYHYNDCFNR